MKKWRPGSARIGPICALGVACEACDFPYPPFFPSAGGLIIDQSHCRLSMKPGNEEEEL